MLGLPDSVLACGIFAHLALRDLQALNVAFTSNPGTRPRLKGVWKSYDYDTPKGMSITFGDL